MVLSIVEADVERETTQVVDFLCAHEWPFHSTPHLAPAQARSMSFGLPSTRTFWLLDDPGPVGLLRVLDLEDIDDGSVVFDLRIAPSHRGRGVGQRAVHWMIEMLFSSYPELHRIEATTRADNTAMRAVLEACGFQLEGRLRETWPTADGRRLDTALYGLLRSDWTRPFVPPSSQ